MALLTLGLNHTTAPLTLREKVAFPSGDAIGGALADLRLRLKGLAPEAAILSTCNRTEIYCKTDAPGEAGEALAQWMGEQHGVGNDSLGEHLYTLPDQQAVRHAFRVACGLDSMVLGEPQILGPDEGGGADRAAQPDARQPPASAVPALLLGGQGSPDPDRHRRAIGVDGGGLGQARPGDLRVARATCRCCWSAPAR